MPIESFVALMQHKQWADAELVRVVRGLPWLARLIVGRFVLAILRHAHAVDCIFRAHLLGVAHGYASANPDEPRCLAELEHRVHEVDAWYVAYARALDAGALSTPLSIAFTDGERQTLTRAEMLLHVALHGTYHRGNAGILLRLVGAGALPDRLTSYLRSARSTARDGAAAQRDERLARSDPELRAEHS
jgi:uncharacterized damage-inducible protein DinB